MPLTKDDEKKLVGWCAVHEVDAQCPMCRKNDWTVGELVRVEPAAGSENQNKGQGTSMIQVICDHCKLILLFAGPPILGDKA